MKNKLMGLLLAAVLILSIPMSFADFVEAPSGTSATTEEDKTFTDPNAATTSSELDLTVEPTIIKVRATVKYATTQKGDGTVNGREFRFMNLGYASIDVIAKSVANKPDSVWKPELVTNQEMRGRSTVKASEEAIAIGLLDPTGNFAQGWTNKLEYFNTPNSIAAYKPGTGWTDNDGNLVSTELKIGRLGWNEEGTIHAFIKLGKAFNSKKQATFLYDWEFKLADK